jgi:hypothetical protein
MLGQAVFPSRNAAAVGTTEAFAEAASRVFSHESNGARI